MSSIIGLHMRCPSGICLPPLLFILYTAELFNIIAGHGLRAHCYADDTQMYNSMPATDIPSTVQRFVQYMDDVSEWMARNRLKQVDNLLCAQAN